MNWVLCTMYYVDVHSTCHIIHDVVYRQKWMYYTVHHGLYKRKVAPSHDTPCTTSTFIDHGRYFWGYSHSREQESRDRKEGGGRLVEII